MDKTATPASIPEPGGPVTFSVTITNDSPEQVTQLTIDDDIQYYVQQQVQQRGEVDAPEKAQCGRRIRRHGHHADAGHTHQNGHGGQVKRQLVRLPDEPDRQATQQVRSAFHLQFLFTLVDGVAPDRPRSH